MASGPQHALRRDDLALNVLVALVLFVVLDFDRPRRGLIQMNHAR